MRVLVFTHMYPTSQHPEYGVFVQQQVESLRKEGVETDVLFVNPKTSKWNYPWSLFRLLKRAYTRRYDLIHAHYVFAGLVARCQFHLPLVVTHHGDETFHGWQRRLCWGISRLASGVIVPSAEVKRAIGLEDAAVIPCGVDFELFKPMAQDLSRKELGLPQGKGLILFAGDYLKQLKRFDLIQEAVALVKAKAQDVDLVVAFKQPYEKIPLYMNACDVLVLASDREGSPQVIKEAMACNLPVVTVNVGDTSEVLEGVDGCHVCEQNAEEIASKLFSVLSSHRRTNGRELTRRYEIQSIAKKIIIEYEKALGDRLRPDLSLFC